MFFYNHFINLSNKLHLTHGVYRKLFIIPFSSVFFTVFICVCGQNLHNYEQGQEEFLNHLSYKRKLDTALCELVYNLLFQSNIEILKK